MTLQIGNTNAESAYEQIVRSGVSPSEASRFIGEWLVGLHQHGGRTFDYHTAFPGTETDCQPHFVRSFHHTDWHDGQDLVQAEQGGGELGFNLRFHRIENDLDALASDTAELFLCLAEMRSSLRAILDEIKLELNRLNTDVAECCNREGGVIVDPGPGRVGKWLGTTEFLGSKVTVYQDPRGELFVAPGINIIKGGGGDPANERVAGTKELGQYMAENKKVAGLFKEGPVTKEQFVKVFGGDVTAGGQKVSDLVDILPAGSHYASPETFLGAVADRQGAAVRTSGAADVAITASFELGTEVTTVAEAPVASYTVLAEGARTALVTAGVSTVGEIARMTGTKLRDTLAKNGVQVGAGEAAGMVAAAKALAAVR